MVTITTEDVGSVTADNEKEAMKLVRKARKESKKLAIIEEENRKMACMKAYEMAYNIYDRKARGNGFPGGWRVKYPDPSRVQHKLGGDIVKYETRDSMTEYNHYGLFCHAILENGVGFDMAVWLTDKDTGKMEMLAIGAHNGIIVFTDIFGIDPTDINPDFPRR